MHRDDFGAGPRFLHGGGPEKAGQRLPKLGVQVLVGLKSRQQVAFAGGGQRQDGLILERMASGFGGIRKDRDQLFERTIQERQLAAAAAGKEHKAAGLLRALNPT